MVIGGSASDFISAFMYYFHSFEVLSNGWKLAVIAGVSEEIAKGIPSIVCVLVLKKKSPSAGFLIGAAVGTWFSITENASYIHTWPMYMMVVTATARAFGCMFSHAVWTALITRAFCKYGLKSYKFYLVVLINMALHFCIDMPLNDYLLILFAEAALCGLCAFIWGVAVIRRERRAVLLPAPEQTEITFDIKHKSRITMSSCLIVMCVLLLTFSAVYSKSYYEVTHFTVNEFLTFAHDGFAIEVDSEREFDETCDINYFEQYEEGKLTAAYQKVTDGDITYIYCYYLRNIDDENDEEDPEDEDDEDEDEQTPAEEMKLLRTDVIITVDGEECKYYPTTYMYGNFELVYYRINPELANGKINGIDIVKNEVSYSVEHNGWDLKTIIAFSVCSATALAWLITYIVFKKKMH